MPNEQLGNKPTVFVIQDNPQHAFWPAERFGDLRHCLPPRGDFKPNQMVSRLRDALRDFKADDYLLLSGAPMAAGVAFAILHERFDVFNVLRWSVPLQDYTATKLNIMSTKESNGDSDADTE